MAPNEGWPTAAATWPATPHSPEFGSSIPRCGALSEVDGLNDPSPGRSTPGSRVVADMAVESKHC
jgi:hypothetical protein